MIRLPVMAAFASLCVAGSGAAQEPDWDSEQNREVWIGVTQAELRDLTTEAGGVWTDLPDDNLFRISRINWPNLPPVMVREFHCETPEAPSREAFCRSRLMSVHFNQPADLEAWWLEQDRWLAFGRVAGWPALYRVEFNALGTTRGQILSTLVVFRDHAIDEIGSSAADDSGK